ncbi:MAG: hypothetical protein KAT34_12150 [Candidatus Aminicenantes bacterium]|nr:hypothetical protein [Candidatus Aminicenantes bacterium]
MEKIAVLLNPSAGKGKSLKRKSKVEHSLRSAGIPYDLFVSGSEEHLRRLARQSVDDYGMVVGVGGDTTFKIIAGEILKNGSRSRSKPMSILGMVGAGSANDIARGLGVLEVESLCEAIRAGVTRDMDVGCLRDNGREEPLWFFGSLSAGLGTTVNRYIETFCLKHPRLAKFSLSGQVLPGVLAVSRSFSRGLVPMEAELEYGGTTRRIIFSLLVFSNIPFYANGLAFHPAISPFDGRLDAVVIHTDSFRQTLKFAYRLGRGNHRQEKAFEMISSPAFRLTCPQPFDIQADGDIITGLQSLEVSLLPGALKVFSTVKRGQAEF